MKILRRTQCVFSAAVIFLFFVTASQSQSPRFPTDGSPPSMEEIKGLLEAYKSASQSGETAPQIVGDTRAYKIASTVLFSDDFESGAGKWTLLGDWQIGAPTYDRGPAPHGGKNLAGLKLDGAFGANTDYNSGTMTSIAFDVPASGYDVFRLECSMWYEFYSNWYDYLYVEASSDGSYWNNILPADTYPNSYITGNSGQGKSWQTLYADLSGYAGSKVQIRFRLYSSYGGYYGEPGFYVDDLAVVGYQRGNPLVRIMPTYYSWPGAEAVLWGAVVPDNGIGTFNGETFTWDFGDGTDPVTGTITDSNYIMVKHTYLNAGTKSARLTIDISGVQKPSATFTRKVDVNVLVDNLETRRLKAIEDGLRWLYTQSRTDGFIGHEYYRAGETGLAVLAFQEQGHYEYNDPETDIYAPLVKRGINAILSTVQKYEFASAWSQPAHPGQADTNGNGYGYYFLDYAEAAKYSTGVCMLTIVATRKPNEVITNGQASGLTYKQLMQEVCDFFAFTQSDTTSWCRGGWRYSPDHTGDGDHSASQWPCLGMMAAEKEWGCVVPQWVKSEARIWLTSTQGENGSYGYAGDYNSLGLTGAALCEWAFIDENTLQSNVTNALGYMENRWGDRTGREGHMNGNFYSLYAIAKGFRVMHHPDGSQITVIGDHNWWNEYVNHLVNDEQYGIGRESYWGASPQDGKWSTGYWNGLSFSFDVPTMQNSLSILVLSPGVFTLPPVAVIDGPDGVQPNVDVALSGEKSYHSDPQKSIVEWLWDFDSSNGVNWDKPDAVGLNVLKKGGWSAPDGIDTVFVTLRVKDNSIPPMYDTEQRMIVITGNINHPPIAVAGGPYTARPGDTIYLDGTGSYDPDPGDAITKYEWDLNGDGKYDDSTDSKPSIVWNAEQSGLVGLRVYDKSGLMSSAESPVYVKVWTSKKNLKISENGFYVSTTMPKAGEVVSLSVTGQYITDGDETLEKVKIRFYNGNPDSSFILIEDVTVENLKPGDTFTATANWTVPPDFKQSLWVKLDYDDQIMEYDETNNTAFVVIGGQVQPTVTMLYFEPDPARILQKNANIPTFVSLMIQGVANLLGSNIELTFDPKKVKVLSMTPGDFMRKGAEQVSDFGTFDNSAGTITVSLVRMNGVPAGVTGGGAIADIKFLAVADDPTGELKFKTYSLRNPNNDQIPVASTDDGAFEGIGDLIGDFDNDMDVDFTDYTQLIFYWNANDLSGDIVGPPDMPNKAGFAPWSKTGYIYKKDGKINFEDQMVFAMMYNWYKSVSEEQSAKPVFAAKALPHPCSAELTVSGYTFVPGETFTAAVSAENVYNLMGAEMILSYNPAVMKIRTVRPGYELQKGEGKVPIQYSIERGVLTASFVMLDSGPNGISIQKGSIFDVEFEYIGKGMGQIELKELDIRNYINEHIGVGMTGPAVMSITGKEADSQPGDTPLIFALSQNYPNPFNMSTSIDFTIAETGKIDLRIFNALGQEVKLLVSDTRQPGRYTVVWNGTDESGGASTSGVYFVKLTQGDRIDTKRLLLIK